MPSITVDALGTSAGSGGYQNAKPIPATVPVPDFDITIDNLHPTQALDGDYRPCDLKIPLPGGDFEFTERWLHDTSAEWVVSIGAQTGTGVMGERYGEAYAYFHVRGIDVPAYEVMSGISVTRASAPSTPRYAMASDGLSQITGANALHVHTGAVETALDDGEWTQVEAGPGRHKWDQFYFDDASGIYWRIRLYTWPGLDRVEGTAVAVWQDQRTEDLRSAFPQLELSVPATTSIKVEFGLQKGMSAERVDSTTLRRHITLTSAIAIGDGQGLRCRFSMLPGTAPAAERTDWTNSMAWPVKTTADPEFWTGRIGPMRHAGDTCVYPIGVQWGDGGVTFKAHAWEDSRYGFRPQLASYNTPERRHFYTQPPLTGGATSNQGGARLSYGRQHLCGVLGIRGGFPRYLWKQAFSAYWDACMRPTQFPYWSLDGSNLPIEPTGRWILPGDYAIGKVPNAAHELDQRINHNKHKWDATFQHFGKSKDVSYSAGRDSLGGVNGYKSSHHEITLFGTLAILDDIDDHWTDILEINAGHYINNQRQFGQKDYLELGEYRSGRAELAMAWAFEVIPQSARDFLLDFWKRRFGPDTQLDDEDAPYAEYWEHQRKHHEYTMWGQFHDISKAPLLSWYHPSWEFSMSGAGQIMVARLMSKYRQDDTGYKFIADQARVHLKYEWKKIGGVWKTVKGMNYPGRRTVDQTNANSALVEPELEGTGPPDSWFEDPTRTEILSGISIFWWLGSVQEAGRLMLQEFGDTELADKAAEIVKGIVAAFPDYTSSSSVDSAEAAWLMPENHALGNFHTAPEIRITVNALGLDADMGGIDPIDRTFEVVALGQGAGVHNGIYPPGQVAPAPVLREAGAIGMGAGVGVATVNLGVRIQIPIDALGLGAGLGEARGSRNIDVDAIGVSAGIGGLDHVTQITRHGYRGTWRPTMMAIGGWDTMATDAGITIVAGDTEELTVTVKDDNQQAVDCSTASDAEFLIVIPATPYTEEVELVRRSLVDGIDCTSGNAVIDLGDTSAITDTLGIWTLRLTIGGITQTVARSPCRVIGNPIPALDDIEPELTL